MHSIVDVIAYKMKVFVLFCILLIMTSTAKHVTKEVDDDDDDAVLNELDARTFLENQGEKDLEKFTHNFDCVLCKFNMIPCCKPNLCIKKRFRPDECLELKPR